MLREASRSTAGDDSAAKASSSNASGFLDNLTGALDDSVVLVEVPKDTKSITFKPARRGFSALPLTREPSSASFPPYPSRLFSTTHAARDEAALRLGKRWLEASGALEKKQEFEDRGIRFEHYLRKGSLDPDGEDVKQIEKDVDRTCLSKDIHEELYRYFSARPTGASAAPLSGPMLKRSVQRVLAAVVARNPGLGYTQGMNYMACTFLALIPDEADVFWLICTVLEDLRPRDYYSPAPTMLAGFLADSMVLKRVVSDCLPRMAKEPELAEVWGVVQLMFPRWLLPFFYAEVPLKTMLVIIDAFFVLSNEQTPIPTTRAERRGRGEAALFAAVLTVCREALNVMKKREEEGNDVEERDDDVDTKLGIASFTDSPFAAIRGVARNIKAKTMWRGIHRYISKEFMFPTLLRRHRKRFRASISREINCSDAHVSQLSGITGIPRGLLRRYQEGFRWWCARQNSGADGADRKRAGARAAAAMTSPAAAAFAFRTHLSEAETEAWFEAVTSEPSEPLPVYDSPNKRGRQLKPLRPGARFRRLDSQNGRWIKHSKGWSPVVRVTVTGGGDGGIPPTVSPETATVSLASSPSRDNGSAAATTTTTVPLVRRIKLPSLGLKKARFVELLEVCGLPKLPSEILDSFFRQTDSNGSDYVDFNEVMWSLAPLAKDPAVPVRTRARAVFRLFDTEKNGIIISDAKGGARGFDWLSRGLRLDPTLQRKLRGVFEMHQGYLGIFAFETFAESNPHALDAMKLQLDPLMPPSEAYMRDRVLSVTVRRANGLNVTHRKRGILSSLIMGAARPGFRCNLTFRMETGGSANVTATSAGESGVVDQDGVGSDSAVGGSASPSARRRVVGAAASVVRWDTRLVESNEGAPVWNQSFSCRFKPNLIPPFNPLRGGTVDFEIFEELIKDGVGSGGATAGSPIPAGRASFRLDSIREECVVDTSCDVTIGFTVVGRLHISLQVRACSRGGSPGDKARRDQKTRRENHTNDNNSNGIAVSVGERDSEDSMSATKPSTVVVTQVPSRVASFRGSMVEL